MNRKDQMPEELEGVAGRLRAARPHLEPLQLDNMKTRVMARARAQQRKGGALRGRIIVALLSLGLMSVAAGGVVAAGGGSPPPPPSGSGQYEPAHCNKQGNTCNCPDHSQLQYDSQSQSIACQCPNNSDFNAQGNKCSCPSGMKFDDKSESCVPSQGGGGPGGCKNHCSATVDNSQCHDHCGDPNTDTMCHDHCAGTPPSCKDHCNDPNGQGGWPMLLLPAPLLLLAWRRKTKLKDLLVIVPSGGPAPPDRSDWRRSKRQS